MLLTTGEVAKLCGLDSKTVVRWCSKGLKSFRMPGQDTRKIAYDDLIRFLTHHNSLGLLNNRKLNVIHVKEISQCYAAGYLINKYSHNLMIVAINICPIPPKMDNVDVILYGNKYTLGQMNELIKKNGWYGYYLPPFDLEKVVEKYRTEKMFVEKIHISLSSSKLI